MVMGIRVSEAEEQDIGICGYQNYKVAAGSG